MMVLVLMMDGFPVSFLAFSIASMMAEVSVPSATTWVCHPYASNLWTTSSVKEMAVSPSIVICGAASTAAGHAAK